MHDRLRANNFAVVKPSNLKYNFDSFSNLFLNYESLLDCFCQNRQLHNKKGFRFIFHLTYFLRQFKYYESSLALPFGAIVHRLD